MGYPMRELTQAGHTSLRLSSEMTVPHATLFLALSERRRSFTLRASSPGRKTNVFAEEPPRAPSAVRCGWIRDPPPALAVRSLIVLVLVSNVAGSSLFAQIMFPAHATRSAVCQAAPVSPAKELEGWALEPRDPPGNDAAPFQFQHHTVGRCGQGSAARQTARFQP